MYNVCQMSLYIYRKKEMIGELQHLLSKQRQIWVYDIWTINWKHESISIFVSICILLLVRIMHAETTQYGQWLYEKICRDLSKTGQRISGFSDPLFTRKCSDYARAQSRRKKHPKTKGQYLVRENVRKELKQVLYFFDLFLALAWTCATSQSSWLMRWLFVSV